MNDTTTPPTEDIEAARERQRSRQRYSTLMNWSLFLFGALWFVLVIGGSRIEMPALVYAGTASFYLGYAFYFGILFGTDVSITDERDEQVAGETASLAVTGLMFFSLAVYPPGIALEFAGVTELPSLFWHSFYAYMALFLLYGGCHAYVKRTHC